MGLELNVRFPGGKRVDVEVGGFTIPTDQLPRDGGEASAPPPFYLFLGSIATCAGIYALGFCQSRNLSTEGLALSMDWDWDPKRPGPPEPCCGCDCPRDSRSATGMASSRRWNSVPSRRTSRPRQNFASRSRAEKRGPARAGPITTEEV